jgi:hypothetical protein
MSLITDYIYFPALCAARITLNNLPDGQFPAYLVLNIPYSRQDQVAEDEMGGPCSTNGGEEERL